MITQAKDSLPNAHAPYSNFHVAACICTEDDSLYTGVNVENIAYGDTLCAEASAICQMVSHGKKQIKSIVIMASSNELCTPCGSCRQKIHEFSRPDTQIYLCDQEKILKSFSIQELLPYAFTFNSKKG